MVLHLMVYPLVRSWLAIALRLRTTWSGLAKERVASNTRCRASRQHDVREYAEDRQTLP